MNWLITHKTEVLVNLVSSAIWAGVALLFFKRYVLIVKVLAPLIANERGIAVMELVSCSTHPNAPRVMFVWLRQAIGYLACALGFVTTGVVITAWQSDMFILLISSAAGLVFIALTLNLVWPRQSASHTKEEMAEAVREILKDFVEKEASKDASKENERPANQAPTANDHVHHDSCFRRKSRRT